MSHQDVWMRLEFWADLPLPPSHGSRIRSLAPPCLSETVRKSPLGEESAATDSTICVSDSNDAGFSFQKVAESLQNG